MPQKITDFKFKLFTKEGKQVTIFNIWDEIVNPEFMEKNKHLIAVPTTLKDKNGIHIYEGDILSVQYQTSVWGKQLNYNFKGIVTYGEFQAPEVDGVYENIIGWYINDGDGDSEQPSLGEHYYQSEIIGNIFQDKELVNIILNKHNK